MHSYVMQDTAMAYPANSSVTEVEVFVWLMGDDFGLGPPRFLDLNLCSCCLWGTLKDWFL
jgi:hypothetical protein